MGMTQPGGAPLIFFNAAKNTPQRNEVIHPRFHSDIFFLSGL